MFGLDYHLRIMAFQCCSYGSTGHNDIVMYKCQFCCNNLDKRKFISDNIISYLLQLTGKTIKEEYEEMLILAIRIKTKNVTS